MPTTRYCRFCGAPLRSPDARYCSTCGRELVVDSSSAAHQQSPCLMLRIPGQLLREIPMVDSVLTLGRAPESGIVIPVSYVSAQHGRFERRGDVWTYTDQASTNGTYVKGQLVTSIELHSGDVLRIGDPHGNSVGLNFRCTPEAALPHGFGTIELGMALLGKAGPITIGRDPASTIHLPGVVVSWSHARMDAVTQGRVLVDLNSTNGTFVNGSRVVGSRMLRATSSRSDLSGLSIRPLGFGSTLRPAACGWMPWGLCVRSGVADTPAAFSTMSASRFFLGSLSLSWARAVRARARC